MAVLADFMTQIQCNFPLASTDPTPHCTKTSRAKALLCNKFQVLSYNTIQIGLKRFGPPQIFYPASSLLDFLWHVRLPGGEDEITGHYYIAAKSSNQSVGVWGFGPPQTTIGGLVERRTLLQHVAVKQQHWWSSEDDSSRSLQSMSILVFLLNRTTDYKQYYAFLVQPLDTLPMLTRTLLTPGLLHSNERHSYHSGTCFLEGVEIMRHMKMLRLLCHAVPTV